MVGSPLHGAGGNTYLPADKLDADENGNVTELLPVDFLGNTRIIGTNSDIGAYEVTSDVVVAAGVLALTDTNALADFSNANVFSGSDQTYSVVSNSSVDVATPTMTSAGKLNVAIHKAGATTIVVQAVDSNGYVAQKTITVQVAAPTVVSVTPITASPTSSDIVSFTVVFSEAVTGLDDFTDLIVTGSGTAGASAAEFTTSDNVSYTVGLKSVVGDGGLSMALLTGQSIVDNLGLRLATSVTSSVVVIDNTAPVITLVGDAGYTLTQDDSWTDPGSSASDTLDVSVNVTHGGESVNSAVPNIYTITYDATDSAGNNAQRKSRVVTVLSYLGAWSDSVGLTAGVNDAPTADPDGDGLSNLEEFAFNYDPLSAVGESKFRHQIVTEETSEYLSITFPVRTGGTFTGGSGQQALINGALYTIESSQNLVNFDEVVAEITPSQSSGMPSLSSGWEYRTFKINTAISDQPKSFIRVKAVSVE
jgi:hypothetical protein